LKGVVKKGNPRLGGKKILNVRAFVARGGREKVNRYKGVSVQTTLMESGKRTEGVSTLRGKEPISGKKGPANNP